MINRFMCPSGFVLKVSPWRLPTTSHTPEFWLSQDSAWW